jgi:hypothetical protein
MGERWQDELDRWFDEEPPGGWVGSGGGSYGYADQALGEVRTLVLYGDEIVDSWRRPVDGSGYEGAAADIDRRHPRRMPEPKVVEVDRTPAHETELAWLSRLVGSRAALESLTDDPLPDEPLDLTALAERWRPRAASIGGHLDRVVAEFGDPELTTACRRALVRGIRANAGLLSGDEDLRAAAAVFVAVGKGNAVVGTYGTPLRVVQGILGLASVPNDRATRWAHALGGVPGTYWQNGSWSRHPSVPILGSPDLLTSSFRRHLVRLRDLALAHARAHGTGRPAA